MIINETNTTPEYTISPEQESINFGKWIDHLSDNLEVIPISPEIVKSYLESCGADFDISPENKTALGKYSENAKSDGMKAVWGEKWDQYKEWVSETYIPEHEAETKINFPRLHKQKDSTSDKPDTNRKNSGMYQFLCELTGFAIKAKSYEKFKKYTEIRIRNGTAWEEGRKSERVKIATPTSKKREILIGSYPKDFPKKAIEFLSR